MTRIGEAHRQAADEEDNWLIREIAEEIMPESYTELATSAELHHVGR